MISYSCNPVDTYVCDNRENHINTAYGMEAIEKFAYQNNKVIDKV